MGRIFSSSAGRQRGAVLLAVMAVLVVGAGVGGMFGSASPRTLLKQVLHKAEPAWVVAVKTDKQALQIGRDHMGMRINTARAGHLLVLQAGTDGKSLELIFPNDIDKETSIPVGETMLPRSSWQLDAAGPAGEGALLAVVTDHAPDTGAIRAAVARGNLPEFGTYGAALATWRETEPKK